MLACWLIEEARGSARILRAVRRHPARIDKTETLCPFQLTLKMKWAASACFI
jgi:hypothetical protein